MIAALAASCSGGNSSEPDLPATSSRRTVLVYQAACNNLSHEALVDFAEIKEGARNSADLSTCRLLVYQALPDGSAKLVEILNDGSELILQKYPDWGSVSVEQMRQVLSDTKSIAPADDYGLVLWSHASGWINEPGQTKIISQAPASSGLSPLSFGQQVQGSVVTRMSISALSQALEGSHFSFIYFDCCHMASVEALYELRRFADRFVASAAELGVAGMPYHENIPCFFKRTPDLDAAARNTFKFYHTNYIDGGDPQNRWGCTISVIDASALDNLAEATRRALAASSLPQGYRGIRYFRSVVMSTGLYDMWHYINASCSDPQLLESWNEAFRRVVISHRTTPTVYNLEATDFHGLATDIPALKPLESTRYGYEQTAWYADVVSPAINTQN